MPRARSDAQGTSHIEEAEALCEGVDFIRAGRIVAEGSPAELVARHGGERLEDAYLALVHHPRLAMLDEPTAGVDLELRTNSVILRIGADPFL